MIDFNPATMTVADSFGILGLFIFYLAITVAGFRDHQKRGLGDVPIIFLWISFLFLGFVAYGIYVVGIGSFIALLSINTLALNRKKGKGEEVFGWADILVLPTFFSYVIFLFGLNYLGIIACLLPILFADVFCYYLKVGYQKGKGSPLLLYVAFCSWVYLVSSFYLGIL